MLASDLALCWLCSVYFLNKEEIFKDLLSINLYVKDPMKWKQKLYITFLPGVLLSHIFIEVKLMGLIFSSIPDS